MGTQTPTTKLTIPREEALTFLRNKRTCASFVSINGYTNSKGEVSDQQIVVNIDYNRVLIDSLNKLKSINFVEVEIAGEIKTLRKGDKDFDDTKNKIELSLRRSLDNDNEQGHALAQAYDVISKGVKIHKETNEIHIYGRKLKKRVLTEGEYKEIKSRPSTLIRNAIEKQLPKSNWRQFRLANNFDSIAIESEILNPDDLYEEINNEQ